MAWCEKHAVDYVFGFARNPRLRRKIANEMRQAKKEQQRTGVMEFVIETKASTILLFLHGLRGDLHVTFEEGTWAVWLCDLLRSHVTHLVVCNPRKNPLLKDGRKRDQRDVHASIISNLSITEKMVSEP